MIKLLVRIFDPTEGEILINGVNIKNYKLEELYGQMSILFQDYRIIRLNSTDHEEKFAPLTVSENIAIGDIQNHDEIKIQTAARSAGAHQFIEQLPQQYNTKLVDRSNHSISKLLPRSNRLRSTISGYKNHKTDDTIVGADLSGGQWQRLALSRTFMRASSADLLILDEPSSSLDPEAEYNLFRFIQHVRLNKTTIYVTHRFYTTRMATKIAFLAEGKLLEWGTHDQLLAIEGGRYAKLYQLQSEGFSSLGQMKQEDDTAGISHS